MGTKPFLNAALASLYIVIVASFMYYGPAAMGPVDDTVLAPIALLSLFVLSALVMGYLLLYMPIRLYADGQKQEAVTLLLRTILSFGGITVLLILTFLLTILY